MGQRVSYVIIVLGAVAGLVLGALGGLKLGMASSGHPARFWIAVALLFTATVVVTGQALIADAMWLAASALGVLAGGLTGLKYGRDAVLRSLVTPPGR